MSVSNPLETTVEAPGEPDAALGADHPAADTRALPIPGAIADDGGRPVAVRRRLPFAARFQAILIGVMFVGFVLIGQQGSKALYQIGLPVLVLAAFLQIAFGNIPPASNFAKSMKLLLLTWVLVAVVFGLGIALTPFLIDLGREGGAAQP